MPEETSRRPQDTPLGIGTRDLSSPRISYEQFLERADEHPHSEWVDGIVVGMTPVSDRHQDLCGFLESLLRHFVEAHGLGVVRSAPFQMKTGPDLPGREPDVLFLAEKRRDRLRPMFVDGPADLAVEIVSPSSRSRDRDVKFDEYQSGGVREYWILDPDRGEANFWEFGAAGRYLQIEIEDGIFRSRVLSGLWLRIEWLTQLPCPPLLEVLRLWGLVR